MADFLEITEAWGNYLANADDWQILVEGVEPKVGGCGNVYELPNPIDRPNESFAIADMRELEMSEPHMHINGEVEIYIVLKGLGQIAVGDRILPMAEGSVFVTPPDTMHCVIPEKDLVLAVINTPPFEMDNYIVVDPTEPAIAQTLADLKVASAA